MTHHNPNRTITESEANTDPITGSPGAHPVGVGIGAIGVGAAVGAMGGVLGGPVGMAAGAVIGAAVGGLAGKAAAEAVDPTIELKYWREMHGTMPYASSAYAFDEFEPAYRYGWESFTKDSNKNRTFESVESDLSRGWDHAKGSSRLAWSHAKHATKHAWNRMQNAVKSDSSPAAATDQSKGLGTF